LLKPEAKKWNKWYNFSHGSTCDSLNNLLESPSSHFAHLLGLKIMGKLERDFDRVSLNDF